MDSSVTSRTEEEGLSFHSRRNMWRRQKGGIIGGLLVLAIVVAAVFGPLVMDMDPNRPLLGETLLPPFTEGERGLHIFGTDALGRDVLVRSLVGARVSVGVVLAALVLGAGLGLILGVLAGFTGGWVDGLTMRLVDAQLAVPTLITAMLLAAIVGTGIWSTVLVLGVASWPVYGRIMRAEVLKVREEDFIDAVRVLGATRWRQLTRHVVPNLVSTLLVVASLETGRMVLTESALSFIGLGIQPPDASLGSMIQQGQAYVGTAWWLSTVPGIFIVVTVLGLNLVGDWARDKLDPTTE